MDWVWSTPRRGRSRTRRADDSGQTLTPSRCREVGTVSQNDDGRKARSRCRSSPTRPEMSLGDKKNQTPLAVLERGTKRVIQEVSKGSRQNDYERSQKPHSHMTSNVGLVNAPAGSPNHYSHLAPERRQNIISHMASQRGPNIYSHLATPNVGPSKCSIRECAEILFTLRRIQSHFMLMLNARQRWEGILDPC